jgi:hypothetical protein
MRAPNSNGPVAVNDRPAKTLSKHSADFSSAQSRRAANLRTIGTRTGVQLDLFDDYETTKTTDIDLRPTTSKYLPSADSAESLLNPLAGSA